MDSSSERHEQPKQTPTEASRRFLKKTGIKAKRFFFSNPGRIATGVVGTVASGGAVTGFALQGDIFPAIAFGMAAGVSSIRTALGIGAIVVERQEKKEFEIANPSLTKKA